MTETLSTYLTEWLETQRPRLAASTWHAYRGIVDRYLVPGLGDFALDAIEVRDLDRFYARLMRSGGKNGKPLSPRTVQFTHAALRKALSDAIRQGLFAAKPCVDASLPRHDPDVDEVDDDERAIWSAERLRTFLELTVADPLHELWVVAAATGMRRGELLGLRWCNVDLDQGVLHVRRALSQLPDRLTAQASEDVPDPLHQHRRRTSAALQRTRQSHERARSVAGDRWDNRWDLVFTTEDEQPPGSTQRHLRLPRRRRAATTAAHPLTRRPPLPTRASCSRPACQCRWSAVDWVTRTRA
ncbi:MAG: site-specific integrase [Actinobacteria bacterium]|nr:site-specific integrase [Actinomycetota bacterium]